MSAPAPKHRFFVPPEQIDGGRVIFGAEHARQIGTVLRLRVGDHVGVLDSTRRMGLTVAIERLTKTAVEGRIVGEFAPAPEPRTAIAAYPALTQRDKFEQVLQKLVEVGVASVTPVLTARSLVRIPPDEDRYERWRAIAREAAEQCGRGCVPELRPTLTLAAALRRARAAGPALLAYEVGAESIPLRHVLADWAGRSPSSVSLFVGPEGGYEPGEVAAAREAGAQVVSLGPRILRTETASPVFAALVLFALGEMDG